MAVDISRSEDGAHYQENNYSNMESHQSVVYDALNIQEPTKDIEARFTIRRRTFYFASVLMFLLITQITTSVLLGFICLRKTRAIEFTQEEEESKNDSLKIPTILFRARNVLDLQPAYKQRIVFQTVLQNQGNGYNKNDGVFTAPIDGEYLFTVQFCTYGSYAFHFAFMKDNVQMQHAEIENRENACGTFVYLTEMKNHSEVWIKSILNHKLALHTEDIYRMNLFSGILIHAN